MTATGDEGAAPQPAAPAIDLTATAERGGRAPRRRLPVLERWPEDPPPDDGAVAALRRWASHWTFAYMRVVLAQGARAQKKTGAPPLGPADLYVVPRQMESARLARVFAAAYDRDAEKHDGTARLLRALWRVARPTYVRAGLCEAVAVGCGVALPLLVRNLLAVLETSGGDGGGGDDDLLRRGLPYSLSLFLVSIVNGLANHRHRHLAMKTGVALRGAAVNALYEHALRLAPAGRAGLTTGEATNLVAVDAQKLYEVAQEGHLVWALPLSVVLVSVFLYRTLGPATLVGTAVLVLFVPLIERVTARMTQVRSCRAAYSDRRVELVSTLLQGMKVAKLNRYEESYRARIVEARHEELKYLSREMAIWATTLLMTVSSPLLATAACFTTYVLVDGGKNVLTASDTFGVLLLFAALRFPINFAGRLMGKASQALSAVRRISRFLDRPLRQDSIDDEREDSSCSGGSSRHCRDDEEGTASLKKHPLKLSNAVFQVGSVVKDNGVATPSGFSFTISEFNFSLVKGEVLAVCGPVGAGKSTLINGILGEARAVGSTEIVVNGQVAYVPQTPFIMNRSVRENILFGRSFDPDWYRRVLDACCLGPDLEQLGKTGDRTEIGERGVTLSGGQKQRIGLARAAYARAALVVLDDPFSALDAGTGREVFDRLIAANDALLRGAAALLVTHAPHFITHRAVDRILLMVDGKNRFLGSWDGLAEYRPPDENTRRAVDHITSSVRESTLESKGQGKEGEGTLPSESGKPRDTGRLIQVETREQGLSSVRTWLLWFRRAGGVTFLFLQVFLMTIDRFAYVAVEFFLARWTSAVDGPITILGVSFPAQTDGYSAQAHYVKVYLAILFVSIFATFLRSEWAVTGGGRAARVVFDRMLASVLRAPMSYFETVPMGRILNRFTYDVDVIDVTLTQAMSTFMISISWYVAGVVVQCSILPWNALAIFPVSLIYWVLMLHYRKSGPDLQRIDALSRSPLQSMVTECLEGSTTIRVFRQGRNFVHDFREAVDTNSSALLNFVSAQRWLGVRIELCGSLVVLVPSILVVCLNDILDIEPGLIGLLIVWSSSFTITLNFLVDTFSDAEAAITAIERVDAMANLPTENEMEPDSNCRPNSDWPERGLLEFVNVSLRYREGLPLALNNLSFKIPAGKMCGVVGRTGAGKSSISVALFRLVEIESGNILLDGVDLGKIGLDDVRGRGMAIIPQDPFLAGATLRECLDPFDTYDDDAILEALRSIRLTDNSADDSGKILLTKVEEGGSNYSVGERQLLNLARVLLSQPKVLVLDEATASIDGETDAFIQSMLRTRFPNTTLFTIAHRLNTIMDYDLTLVMDAGRAVEFGPPAELLDIKGGIFAELVDATGADNSRALRDMGKQVGKE